MLKAILVLVVVLLSGCSNTLEDKFNDKKQDIADEYIERYKLDCQLSSFKEFPKNIVSTGGRNNTTVIVKNSSKGAMGRLLDASGSAIQSAASISTSSKLIDTNKDARKLHYKQCLRNAINADPEYKQRIGKLNNLLISLQSQLNDAEIKEADIAPLTLDNKLSKPLTTTQKENLVNNKSVVNSSSMTDAAEQGNAKAQYTLGAMYYKGFGVLQDYKQALKWHQKAAEQDEVKAQYALGVMYYKGHGVLQDYKQAFKWFQKAAEQNDAKAQYVLGLIYMNGLGVLKNDKQAANWYLKSAKKGYATSQYNAGVLYRDGRGVLQDYKEAIKWFLKASLQGDKAAQYNIGVMYDNGQGVLQDYSEAAKWYQKAAVQGDEKAQYNLGVMYGKGQGVIQSNKKSHVWYAIAASNGHKKAFTYRQLVAKKLSAYELEQAKEEAVKLNEKINDK